MSTKLPPMGWYEDPGDPGHVRWWDGQDWTDHVQASATASFTPPADLAEVEERRWHESQPDGPVVGAGPETTARVRDASDTLDQRVKSWKAVVGDQRKALETAHSRYTKSVKAANRQVKIADKPKKLAGSFMPVSVFETHLEIEGKHFELQPGIHATVDSAGNISRTRRLTLTRTAMFGVGTLFMPKATKHDDRELYLLVEAPEWAEVVKLDANRRRQAQQLAQEIVLASAHAQQHQTAYAERRTQAKEALQSALSDLGEIEEGERLLLERDDAGRADVREARNKLEEVLELASASTERHVKKARKRLAEVDAALEASFTVPPRPDAASAAAVHDDAVLDGAHDAELEDSSVEVDHDGDGNRNWQGSEDKEKPVETRGAPANETDPFEAIRHLAELRDGGLITEAQFEHKRAEMLDRL